MDGSVGHPDYKWRQEFSETFWICAEYLNMYTPV